MSRGGKKREKAGSSAHGQCQTYLLSMIPIEMSSLYLSEVHYINLVKWIQRAKILQSDMRLRTEDQMALQIGGGKYKAVSRYKE